MQWGPRWSQNGGGAHAHVVGASMIPNLSSPPPQCGRGLDDPKFEEPPVPMWR